MSIERAKSVMFYITAKGITSNRLTAKGYGSAAPVASNAKTGGKEMNRRTELKILEQ